MDRRTDQPTHQQKESHAVQGKTRPDTRQDSRGWLGRSSNAKTARNSKMLRTDGRTDRHGKV